MSIGALATYRPAWDAGDGARRLGPDEDVVTLAVSAARPLVDETVRRVLLVTRAPDVPAAVIATALGLEPDTPVEVRLGGGPAALAALAEAAPGTLVIAVSPETPAGSAAALAGDGGAELGALRAVAGSLPAADDDPRLMRERGTRPAVAAVLNGVAPAAIAGVAAAEQRRLGAEPAAVRVAGAAEPLFALAASAAGGLAAAEDAPSAPAAADAGSVATAEAPAVTSGRIVAVDGASAVAVDVSGAPARLVEAERPAVAAAAGHEAPPGRIPLSLAAHSRAFEAKVGLRAARCACGRLSYPPRSLCLDCERTDATEPVALPRRGEVYTTVTIRTPVPGIAGPYSLAIVALDGVDVRFLVHITGAPPASVRIGDSGELVLRRIAVRDGVPDYGYGFQPDEVRS